MSVSRISNAYLISGYYQGAENRDVSNYRVNFGGLSRLDRNFLESNILPTPHPARQEHCTGCRMTKCLSCEADPYNLDPLTRIENELLFKSITFRDSKFSTELPFNQHITQLPNYYKEAVAVMCNFEKKLVKNEVHLHSYNDQIQKMIDDKIVSIIEETRGDGSYITSNIALNSCSTSTPLRIVHNGSFSTQNRPSLNDCLLKGSSGNRKIAPILNTLRLSKFWPLQTSKKLTPRSF